MKDQNVASYREKREQVPYEGAKSCGKSMVLNCKLLLCLSFLFKIDCIIYLRL